MTSKHNAFVSCVIYVDTRPDHETLQFFKKLDDFLTIAFSAHEIILVNDTGLPISELQPQSIDVAAKSNIILMDLAFKHGIERAMLAGSDLAVGDFLFEIDYLDPSLPMTCLTTVFEYAQGHGVDIVGGTSSRYQPRSSRLFYKVIDLLKIAHIPLSTEVVRVVSRRALNRTLADRRNIRYRKLLYSLSGFAYEQVDVGDVMISLSRQRSYRIAQGLDLIVASSRFGSSAAALSALTFLALSMLTGIYALIVWLLGLPVASGWTTIMGLLSLGFSGIFAVLSLLSRMVSIALDEVQNADPYRVRAVVRLGNR